MDSIELLKKQIAEETKEKYDLYKRIKELVEENEKLKEQLDKKDG
jgi:regulator of replication initiation timing